MTTLLSFFDPYSYLNVSDKSHVIIWYISPTVTLLTGVIAHATCGFKVQLSSERQLALYTSLKAG